MIKKKYKIVKNIYFKRIFFRENVCNKCYFKDINCANIRINNQNLHSLCSKSSQYEDFTLGGLFEKRSYDNFMISYIPDNSRIKEIEKI